VKRPSSAVAGIRDGGIAWMFPSERLIEAGCYPGKRALEAPAAKKGWQKFVVGNDRYSEDGMALLKSWLVNVLHC
jgi:hypothetical protein